MLYMGSLATKNNVSRALLRDPKLSQYVPETALYSKTMLQKMLDRYEMVYVKPNMGTGGKDILRVEDLGQGGYKYHLKTSVWTFGSFDSMAGSIDRVTRRCDYVIQRGIDLLRRNGRLFDLRVMVQKNPYGKWETTGVIGRLGHPRKIVTNVCRGGCSRPVEVLLRDFVYDVAGYTDHLRQLGERAARQLNKTFPRIKELGFDIGIDRNLHPWILEANPRPAIYGFKTLKDKSIYQRMHRYQRWYGR